MARQLTFRATLHFTLDSHAELTSLRSSAISFCSTYSGSYDLTTNEDDDNLTPYYAKLVLHIPVASRAQAATRMGTIDSALSGLPDLVKVNREYLKYDFIEREV